MLSKIWYIIFHKSLSPGSVPLIFPSHAYRHENISGFYRVSAFFLAKVFADLIPMRVIPICFYSLIVYFMVGKCSICMYIYSNTESLFFVFTGFQDKASKFFIFTLALSLTSISAASITLAISAGTNTIVVATILLAFVIIFAMVGKIYLTITYIRVYSPISLYCIPLRLQNTNYHSPYPINLKSDLVYRVVIKNWVLEW